MSPWAAAWPRCGSARGPCPSISEGHLVEATWPQPPFPSTVPLSPPLPEAFCYAHVGSERPVQWAGARHGRAASAPPPTPGPRAGLAALSSASPRPLPRFQAPRTPGSAAPRPRATSGPALRLWSLFFFTLALRPLRGLLPGWGPSVSALGCAFRMWLRVPPPGRLSLSPGHPHHCSLNLWGTAATQGPRLSFSGVSPPGPTLLPQGHKLFAGCQARSQLGSEGQSARDD